MATLFEFIIFIASIHMLQNSFKNAAVNVLLIDSNVNDRFSSSILFPNAPNWWNSNRLSAFNSPCHAFTCDSPQLCLNHVITSAQRMQFFKLSIVLSSSSYKISKYFHDLRYMNNADHCFHAVIYSEHIMKTMVCNEAPLYISNR